MRKFGLLGIKAARSASELATAAAGFGSRTGFGLGESLAAYAGSAAERAAVRLDGTSKGKWLAPVLTSVVVGSGTVGAVLASAKELTAAGLEVSAHTVELGLSAGERLLADSAQFARLAAALPKVATLVRQFAADMPETTAPALIQALYALSCIQTASGPIATPARAVCDGCALSEPQSALTPALQPDEATELCHMVRYAMAAYGGAALAVLRAASVREISAALRGDNRAGTAARLGIPVSDILIEGVAAVHRPAHFVAIDHRLRRVILSLRGTVNVLDSLTNLQCGTARLSDDSGAAHEGMLSAARELAAGQVGAAIAALTESHPDYQLRVTGHSQGAGVAALLVHHWQHRYPNIRGYVFAPPCVLTLAAAKALGPRLVSVVYGDDIIPRLSLGSVEDLRNASAALASEPRLCGRIHAAIGSDFPDLDDVVSPVAEPIDGEADAQRLWMMSIRSTLFAVMQAEKLYCPGRILWIPGVLGSDGTVAPAGTARWAEPEQFCEIVLSGTMFTVRPLVLCVCFPNGSSAHNSCADTPAAYSGGRSSTRLPKRTEHRPSMSAQCQSPSAPPDATASKLERTPAVQERASEERGEGSQRSGVVTTRRACSCEVRGGTGTVLGIDDEPTRAIKPASMSNKLPSPSNDERSSSRRTGRICSGTVDGGSAGSAGWSVSRNATSAERSAEVAAGDAGELRAARSTERARSSSGVKESLLPSLSPAVGDAGGEGEEATAGRSKSGRSQSQPSAAVASSSSCSGTGVEGLSTSTDPGTASATGAAGSGAAGNSCDTSDVLAAGCGDAMSTADSGGGSGQGTRTRTHRRRRTQRRVLSLPQPSVGGFLRNCGGGWVSVRS